ncbi:MAG: AAA family ATPase [Leptospira sp.]|nr:AAA family ATPase [Leptospira sp.]
MSHVSIAGIKVPLHQGGNASLIFPSDLVETDATRLALQNILYPMLEGRPVLLVGDAGVGKNALIYYINSKIQKPTLRFSLNEDTLPEDLIGSYRVLLDGQGFEWADGPLTRALRENSSFVADEMNLATPHILKRFSSVYESSFLDLLEGGGERVKGGAGFHFVGTQNPSEGFEGRKPLPFDITKHFSVVFIDPHTPDEILFILSKIYPNLGEDFLKRAIRTTIEIEKMVKLGEIGRGDLEKYHFNIRVLKKLCSRVLHFGKNDEVVFIREVNNLYKEPFRKEEDRQKVIALIQEEWGSLDKTTAQVKLQIREGSLLCNDKILTLEDENKAKSLLTTFPLPEPILGFMEKIITSYQNRENVLIEYRDDQDPQVFFPLITEIMGTDVALVSLSKGVHTSDIVGSLKPVGKNEVNWTDGPLTRGIRNGSMICITGLESAGAELVEKMNMLTDDARSLALPPESGTIVPIALKDTSRVIAFKSFRHSKSSPTISRAFRNRFTPILFPELEDISTLKELLSFYLPEEFLPESMARFHLKLKDLAHKRTIGSANLVPYAFGVSNLLRWKDHILHYNDKDIKSVALRGGKIAYTNQIADPKERQELEKILDYTLQGIESVSSLFEKIEEKKKTFTTPTDIEKKRWWDPELHKRDPLTGKAKRLNSGDPLKRGIEINTPETGGNTKEGPDAWYGKDTRGNMGQGEPAGGGGAWGYRTDELYKQFLQKRRLLWDYRMVVSKEEFMEIFGKELEEVEMNLERLFDPEVDITRMYRNEGSRIDARRYLNYKNGRGDSRIFDKTLIEKNEEKLKGVEVVVLVSKCRRVFNFDYSVAVLSALLTTSYILRDVEIDFSVHSYSDLKNSKDKIDIIAAKRVDQEFDELAENDLFNFFTQGWEGDSIPEYQILENLDGFFQPESQTRIVVVLSDFRGQRAKAEIEDEIGGRESQLLRQVVRKNESKNYVFLGVGLGSRYIAEHIFHDSIQITSENFYNMPNLIGSELSRLILTHHSQRMI